MKVKDKTAPLILELPRPGKRLIALTVDASFCVLSLWLAFYLRTGEFALLSGPSLWAALISIALALPIFVMSGLYRAVFRYAGWPAILAVARAMVIYTLAYVSIVTAIGIDGVPRTIGLIQPQLLFFAVAGSRLLARFWLGGVYRSRLDRAALPRALIYGAGEAGRQLEVALSNSREIRVLGFLDDRKELQNRLINGHLVHAPRQLGELVEHEGVEQVLLAVPSAPRRRRNQILEQLDRHHVAVRTLPSMNDLAQGRVSVSDLRELDIEDLLGRDPVAPNAILLGKNITGKVVMVTGAGGSIGSELCRQVLRLKPARLLLVEMSEYALYSIHAELEELQPELGLGQHPVPLLASVQDEMRMRELFDTWRPATVYHAAAYKHVPMVEHNLAEGLKNNVLGTLLTAQLAAEHGALDFVMISTDKAVRPTNVMGASKRLAELCLQAFEAQQQGPAHTRFAMVRFGNVLGSSGSVIPRFREQIHKGGPITLTHPEINRFFMTLSEAAQLVIQAGAMAKSGDVFVLDMGEPVRIADLARRMVELSGLSVRDEQNPEGDIEIQITGLRPGEKLYEELLIGDDPLPTQHERIMRAQDPFIPWVELEAELEVLRRLLSLNDVETILALLGKLVGGYQPSGKVVDWVYNEQLEFANEQLEPA